MTEDIAALLENLIDVTFDALISGGSTPWLVARTGAGMPSASAERAELPAGAADLPRLEGGIFPGLLHPNWFMPEFALPAEADAAFGFKVTQAGVDQDGGPFNRAALTMSLRAAMPSQLAALAESEPVRRVPDLAIEPVLTVPVAAPDGSIQRRPVPGTATEGADGGFLLTFELVGSLVEAAYVHLMREGGVGLEITAKYTAYQTALVAPLQIETLPVATPQVRMELFGDGGNTPGFPFEPVSPAGTYRFFPVVARFSRSLPIGVVFATDDYRSRYTITAENLTRTVIDANDLNAFAGPRSEYRELTSLGDVPAKYPSLRRLYFGAVSGTVVALPAAYGIQRTAQGLQASCDSIVDTTPGDVTGCRFHFTFTVFPMADPVDLAQVRADVLGIPEAKGRTLRVVLPGGLDSRTPPSLEGFASAKTAFSDAQVPAINVGVEIADAEGSPAVTNVNLFLQQLGSAGPPPLFGTVAVRLDDVFPSPVQTQVVLNLRKTAGGDELVTTGPQAANRGPLDLVLRRFAAVQGNQVTITALGDQALPAGGSATLAGVPEGASVEVSRTLAVPTPFPKTQMAKYVAFHTHTVQQILHPLTVNAAGLDFAAAGVTAIDVQITMTANPATPIPSISLNPSHAVDFRHVAIPVESAVTGLDCSVALTLTAAAGPRTVTVRHDFMETPILILTPNTIA